MLSQLTQSRKTRCHGDKEDFHEEYQYLNLISDILEHGENIESRNGKQNSFLVLPCISLLKIMQYLY